VHKGLADLVLRPFGEDRAIMEKWNGKIINILICKLDIAIDWTSRFSHGFFRQLKEHKVITEAPGSHMKIVSQLTNQALAAHIEVVLHSFLKDAVLY
jgi:hypothetical protein